MLTEIKGFFDSGGIEFVFPKIIENFQDIFSIQIVHFITFNCEERYFIKEVVNLVNEKFLVNGKKVNSIDEIFQTILKEVSCGFLYKKNYLLFLYILIKMVYYIQ